MWHDAMIVFGKEWKALADQLGGDSRAGLWAVAALFVGLSTFAAFFAGPAWVESPVALVNYPLLAASIAIQPIVDSFAGERERHTLETLLASRLSDRSIVVGKIMAAVIPAFVAGLLLLGLGLAVVNLKHGNAGGLILPAAALFWATVALIALLPLLVAGAGVIVSIDSSTVRRAQQLLGFGIVGALLLPFLVVMAAPDGIREELLALVTAWDRDRLIFLVLGIVALVAIGLLLVALTRFRRGKLPMD